MSEQTGMTARTTDDGKRVVMQDRIGVLLQQSKEKSLDSPNWIETAYMVRSCKQPAGKSRPAPYGSSGGTPMTRSAILSVSVDLQARLAIQAGDHIGEGPTWDAAARRLLWVDHAGDTIHAASADGGGWRESKRWTVGHPLASAIPRSRGGLLVTGGDEIFLMSELGDTVAYFASMSMAHQAGAHASLSKRRRALPAP